MSRPQSDLDRREFLKTSGVGLGAAALGGSLLNPSLLANGPPSRFKTRHVVVVAFAGGVRSKETIGTPENIPSMMRMAADGVVCPNVKAQNLGHYGAALSMFTGCAEVFGIRENARSENPTVFEYVRKALRFSANEVWLSTTGGNQQVNYSHGTHPKFGSRYGANLISADGVFNAEFRNIIQDFGRPQTLSMEQADATDRLRGALDGGLPAEGNRNIRDVEEFILNEIAGKTTSLTGPGAADAKAVRVAGNILKVFKPKLLGIALNQHDTAHGSYNGYVEIIRRNDAEIGLLFDAINADPELRDSTSVFVLPEFGRDRDLNERNGLDHGDGSEELRKVSMIAWGPDFRRGRTVKESFETKDLCPTICKLFGASAEYSEGRSVKGIFA